MSNQDKPSRLVEKQKLTIGTVAFRSLTPKLTVTRHKDISVGQKLFFTVVLNMVFEHLVLQNAAELWQGFQMNDVDDERPQDIVQRQTQILQQLTVQTSWHKDIYLDKKLRNPHPLYKWMY